MKIFFNKVFELNGEYQECFIDNNSFDFSDYNEVLPISQNINGLLYDDIYNIEPKSYYCLSLRGDTPHSFKNFCPSWVLVRAGVIVSNIIDNNIFIYNTTENNVYLRAGTMIGEIE